MQNRTSIYCGHEFRKRIKNISGVVVFHSPHIYNCPHCLMHCNRSSVYFMVRNPSPSEEWNISMVPKQSATEQAFITISYKTSVFV